MKAADLVIRNLSIGYTLKHNSKKVVKSNINEQLYKGEVTCLLGSNGSGKSTLLRTLAGFQDALDGDILYKEKSIKHYSDAERSLLIGLVLTDKIYAGGISVFDLVSLGRHPHTGFFGSLKKEDNRIVLESMEKAGIIEKKDAYVAELSDGERQKAMIAKALAQECPIILLDEPTAFLDISSRIETMYLLKELATKEQKSILLSTHDIESAIRMGDRFWLMDKVLPFTSGIPEDLILSHTFSSFFDKGYTYFDASTGILEIKQQSDKVIYLSGNDLVCFWVTNLLKKNNIKAIKEDGFPQINCSTINEYSIKETESSSLIIVKTMEELLAVIK